MWVIATEHLVLLMRISGVTAATEGCWLWPKGKTKAGYGRHKKQYVHRVAYEAVHGPIPKGWHVHHTCHVRHCFNPADLEAKSQPAHRAAHRRNPKRCPAGHLYAPGNLRANKERECLTCHREAQARRNAPKRAATRERYAQRVRDVTRLRAEGLSRQEVAEHLGISKESVRRVELGLVKFGTPCKADQVQKRTGSY